MRTVSFSEARNNLKSVLDRVVEDADVTIIHRRDAEDVVVMSLTEWNSWQETAYLLSSPENARRLYRAIADLDAGKGIRRELIEADAVKYGVQETHAAYRAKGARTKSKKTTAKRSSRRG